MCLGGLMHSIYGTNVFKHQTTADRELVRMAVGEKAERLAWLFCNLNRPRVILIQEDRDRILDPVDGEDLVAIEIANLLEQGGIKAVAHWF